MAKEIVRRILVEPFTRRPWTELAFYLLSGGLAGLGLMFVGLTMVAGVALAITFFGVAVLALSVRSARGLGGWTRSLAGSMLGEHIDEPEPFVGKSGFLGWLQSSLRDRVGWRGCGLPGPQSPLDPARVLRGLQPVVGCRGLPDLSLYGIRCPQPPGLRDRARPLLPVREQLRPPRLLPCRGRRGRVARVFLLAAPWVMRGFVNVDRMLMRALLGPDPMATRVRTLEQARSQTVDASAATLRRIERDLHDGTQAQLVALAMRLGMAKEKLGRRRGGRSGPGTRADRRGAPWGQGGHRRVA